MSLHPLATVKQTHCTCCLLTLYVLRVGRNTGIFVLCAFVCQPKNVDCARSVIDEAQITGACARCLSRLCHVKIEVTPTLTAAASPIPKRAAKLALIEAEFETCKPGSAKTADGSFVSDQSCACFANAAQCKSCDACCES